MRMHSQHCHWIRGSQHQPQLPPSAKSIVAMVFPMGPMLAQRDVPVPEIVADKYAKYWWGLGVMCLIIAALQVVAIDIIATFFYGMIGGIIIYMVKDNCKNMSMYCLMVNGLVCSIQAIFDTLHVLTCISGRRTTSTIVQPGASSDVTTYTTKVTVHPFFDSELGVAYNVQSGLLILTPLVMICIAVLSYYSYHSYTASLFPEDEEGGLTDNGFGNNFGTYGAPSYGGMRPAEQRPSSNPGAWRQPIFSGNSVLYSLFRCGGSVGVKGVAALWLARLDSAWAARAPKRWTPKRWTPKRWTPNADVIVRAAKKCGAGGRCLVSRPTTALFGTTDHFYVPRLVTGKEDVLPEVPEPPFQQGKDAGCALRLWAGAHMIQKAHGPCEDAFFVDPHSMGVADGVGGMAELKRSDINSAKYAAELMEFSSAALKSDGVASEQKIPNHLAERAKTAVQHAESQATAFGASTVAVLCQQGKELGVANLGDSGFMVLRKGPGGMSIVIKSEVQQHRWNQPYQMARFPQDLLRKYSRALATTRTRKQAIAIYTQFQSVRETW
eukprot:s109_g53.t1